MTDSLPPPPDEPPVAAPPRGGPSGGSSRAYDRVPPHSLEAEVSVLGAALLSKNAVADVIEVLRPEYFYRNAHRQVFEGILDLHREGAAIDTVTITDWLARRGRLDEVGGAAAVYDLTVAVPTAANAGYYAGIVREKALLRRLIDVGTEVVKLGFEATDDAETIVDRAESLVYEVAQTGTVSDYARLGDLLTHSFEQIEKLADQRSEVTGLATGYNDFDRLTAGLQPQNLVIIAARPAMGKCLTGDTLVLDARSGQRKRIDQLFVEGVQGFEVFAVDGRGRLRPAPVAAAVDNGIRPVFSVRTRSGRVVRATANHPLLCRDGWRELSELRVGERIAVPRRLAVQGCRTFAHAEVALLGYLLGDGSIASGLPALTTMSPAVEEEAARCAAAFGTAVSKVEKKDNQAFTLFFRGAHSRVTREQLADQAGVSPWAVSEVTAGRGGVAAATRGRVTAVIEELGYTGEHHPNHVRAWLQELGVWGCNSHDKFIPDVVFELAPSQIATFLSRIFSTDGSAWVAEEHGYFGISYASVSEQLIRGVQHLLLRLGILSSTRERHVAYNGTRRPSFELEIRDAVNVLRFLDQVGIYGKEDACEKVRVHAEKRSVRHSNTDLVPKEVSETVLEDKGDRLWAEISETAGRPRDHNRHVGTRQLSRRTPLTLAEAMSSDQLRDIAESDLLWDEVVAIEPAGVERVYDLTVPGYHNFVANDLIVHNSSLALGLAHYVTAKISRPTILFSLEMSETEIVNRLLSAEARIDSGKLRTGRLDDADWLKLGDALGTLSEAPLFIDDTPSITLNEIRAKCRRLKQKHGLDLVIVDYLQLMQTHRRVDNRQQEVAEISRGLKMLAKEMDAPVIALSQLSRQPESRTDKRPMLADLRESGCLTRQTRLFRADTGAPITFGELLDQGLRDVPVWATGPDGKLVPGRLTHAFPSGRKPVYRVTLRSGLRVEATANHPFRTLEGWAPLGELREGVRVAAARRLPEPSDPQPMDPDELVLLAHLIGQGTIVARQPIHYTSTDAANLEAVEKSAWNRFGITARRDRDGRSQTTMQLYLPAPHRLTHGQRNPIAAWLDELGLWDRRAYDKHLPPQVFALPQDQVRRFLAELWATDGCLHVRPAGQSGPPVSLYYASSSLQLAQDVALLLRRVGLLGSLREVTGSPAHPGYQVWISGTEQQRRFLTDVGIAGSRAARIPPALAALDDDGLRERAVDDLVWDEIVASEPIGERDVYDATVADLHNFVAEGLVLHNSIEQDADIVGFIYRDEVYHEDSPDKGIAELIVAKHRNGATGVVKLAFLSHLTTFANLARNAGGSPQGGGQSNGGPPPPTPV